MCTSQMRVEWGLPARLGDAEQGRGEVPYVQRGAVPAVKSRVMVKVWPRFGQRVVNAQLFRRGDVPRVRRAAVRECIKHE